MAKETSWEQAIMQVLKDCACSMRYDKIAEEIINRGLRKKVGLTPANTVNVCLNKMVNDNHLVMRIGKGEYILKEMYDRDPEKAVQISVDNDDEEETNNDDALITAYGRFWSRTVWEENKKRLYGTSARTANASGLDFADMAGIYLLHKGYEVIYVGQAKKMIDRIDAHTRDDKRNRWDNFSWFCLDPIDDEIEKDANKDQKSLSIPALLDTLEALLIETLGPERNKKVGNGFEDKEFEQLCAQDFLERELKNKK